VVQINITRRHGPPFVKTRAQAHEWARAAQGDFGLESSPVVGGENDSFELIHFKRSGLQGSLRVTPEWLELEISLGFLLGTFKDRMEAHISKNLQECSVANLNNARLANERRESPVKT
jgi:putative polyhydroxyalkanoate system protein